MSQQLPLFDLESFFADSLERSLSDPNMGRITYSPVTQEVQIEYKDECVEFFNLNYYPTYKIKKKKNLIQEVKAPPLVI